MFLELSEFMLMDFYRVFENSKIYSVYSVNCEFLNGLDARSAICS